jgi:hypothetical protein
MAAIASRKSPVDWRYNPSKINATPANMDIYPAAR